MYRRGIERASADIFRSPRGELFRRNPGGSGNLKTRAGTRLSRLITRNAPQGRFVITCRETRYTEISSARAGRCARSHVRSHVRSRELLRSCVIRAISRFNLRADIILLALFRWEVFLREVEVETRIEREKERAGARWGKGGRERERYLTPSPLLARALLCTTISSFGAGGNAYSTYTVAFPVTSTI